MPQTPNTSRTPVVASTFGPYCPQSLPQVPGAGLILGNEDCLYLNVYAPARQGSGNIVDNVAGDETKHSQAGSGQASPGLPVVVWIHGGGYGEGDGTQDMSSFINTNDNGLLAIVIQYRVRMALSVFLESSGCLMKEDCLHPVVWMYLPI